MTFKLEKRMFWLHSDKPQTTHSCSHSIIIVLPCMRLGCVHNLESPLLTQNIYNLPYIAFIYSLNLKRMIYPICLHALTVNFRNWKFVDDIETAIDESAEVRAKARLDAHRVASYYMNGCTGRVKLTGPRHPSKHLKIGIFAYNFWRTDLIPVDFGLDFRSHSLKGRHFGQDRHRTLVWISIEICYEAVSKLRRRLAQMSAAIVHAVGRSMRENALHNRFSVERMFSTISYLCCSNWMANESTASASASVDWGDAKWF